MSGNAMEEGLILQIHNPSHTDPSRFGFLCGALSGFATLVGLGVLFPNLPRLLSVYLSIGAAVAIGTWVTRATIRRREQKQADGMQAKRELLAAETARQIIAMKSRQTAP